MVQDNGRTRRGVIPVTSDRAAPYEMMKQAILRGELEPGQQLIETALAEWCQVSRTPIREALSRLVQDGLAERSDRGLIVRRRSPEEILDIYETRIVLEATVGRVAAQRRSEFDVHTLHRIIERARGVAPDDERKVEVNRQFHLAMWRASHNDSLLDLLERLNLHLARYPATTLSHPGRWEEAKQEHGAILDAVEARDEEKAHDLALAHFTRARDIRLRLWDELPGDA
ncbi:MAG TPA: GntR family transcriptional regulator [Trebonia sp.]|jgi:DNA-binding GntR family transcriptional regulator